MSSITDLTSKTTDCCAEKDRIQVALERILEVAVMKESVFNGEMTFAVKKSRELQKLKSALGTFLWRNLGANNVSSPVSVQFEDLFMGMKVLKKFILFKSLKASA